ncbi:flavin reductase family protein [Anaerosporobacter faecicola]|uniref:flavin reductase family protein n=1 Tax=Anaerosporobacter faecicola TaxID=2718714 RepID=UPI00143B56A9|nr:flavin reductase family protein [Anaerosporobacter faecicola]
MKNFKEIQANDFNQSIFPMFEKDWALIATEAGQKANAMTASCGGIGVLYPYGPVAFIFVRPQRYTQELIQQSDTFSLNFFSPSYHDILAYFGKVSGRDEDKIKKSNLTLQHTIDTPYFEEANTVFVCKKVYVQQLTGEGFLDASVPEKGFPENDFHYMYIGKIEKVLLSD